MNLSLITAGIKSVAAGITGKETTISVSSCRECCQPTLKTFKVSHFIRVPSAVPGMFDHKWVSEIVEAYTADEAAEKLGLKAGYNCFVSCQIRRKP